MLFLRKMVCLCINTFQHLTMSMHKYFSTFNNDLNSLYVSHREDSVISACHCYDLIHYTIIKWSPLFFPDRLGMDFVLVHEFKAYSEDTDRSWKYITE